MLKHRPPTGSDHESKFIERDGQPPDRWFLHGQFVVTLPKVLDECVPRDDHPGAAVLLGSDARAKQDRNARIVIAGHGFVHLRRGHYELAVEEPVARRLAEAFDELALAI